MPGAQPRKDPLDKLLSSLARGAAAKAPGSAQVRGTAKS